MSLSRLRNIHGRLWFNRLNYFPTVICEYLLRCGSSRSKFLCYDTLMTFQALFPTIFSTVVVDSHLHLWSRRCKDSGISASSSQYSPQ
jgi:hypothetical protein